MNLSAPKILTPTPGIHAIGALRCSRAHLGGGTADRAARGGRCGRQQMRSQHAADNLLELVKLPSGETAWDFRQPPAAVAPPPIGLHESLKKYKDLHEALSAKGSKSLAPFWWLSPGVDASIAQRLQEQHYCIVDGFLGDSACEQLLGEVRKVRGAGLLQPATVGQGRMHTETHVQRAAFRSDTVGWFTGSESHWRVLPAYLELVDHCVALLRKASVTSGHADAAMDRRRLASSSDVFTRNGAAPAASSTTAGRGGVSNCLQRSRAMLACYARGARYAKHCDNVCHGGEGPACNGRRLTAILYLNPGWTPAHGGELLVYPPLEESDGQKGDKGEGDAPVGCIEPIANRLLLFYADARVPHEVLPSHAERLAITLWYYDSDEVQRANGVPV